MTWIGNDKDHNRLLFCHFAHHSNLKPLLFRQIFTLLNYKEQKVFSLLSFNK